MSINPIRVIKRRFILSAKNYSRDKANCSIVFDTVKRFVPIDRIHLTRFVVKVHVGL